MKNLFKELLDITNQLHSPEGCHWDREQTFESLKPYILEEAHELLDAIDSNNDPSIIEELGDLLYIIIFYSKIADKDNRFSIDDVLSKLCAKLIRRHPHVFTEEKVASSEEAIDAWERMKKEEGLGPNRSSILDSISKTLPALARAQKVAKRMEKSQYHIDLEKIASDDLAQNLLNLVCEANRKGVDLEETLRTLLRREEKRFRAWESENA